MRTRRLASVITFLASLCLALAAGTVAGTGGTSARAQPTSPEDPWPMVGGDASHSGSAEGPAPPYRVAWSLTDVVPLAGPVVAGDAVILVERDRVAAVDRATGRLLWQVDREPGPAGPPAVSDDLVVFSEGSRTDASMSAVGLEDGEAAWSVATRAPSFGGPVVEDGRIYAGTSDGRVVALDAEDGRRLWEYRATGRVDTSPALAEGLLFIASEDFSTGVATVLALDDASGRERWRFSPSGPGIGVSSFSVAEETAVAGLGDFAVHAFDAASGAERWRTPTRAPFSSRLAPAFGESVVVGDRAGHLYRLEPDSGERRWIFRLPGDLLDGSAILAGRWAVVGDGTGQASAIDLDSGLLVWKRLIGTGPIGAVASDGDRLYVAVRGSRGRLVALEHDPDGALLSEASPTTLFVGPALLNYAVAALVVGGILVLLFGWLARGRDGEPASVGAGASEDAT